MAYMDRITACNGWDREQFAPLLIDGRILGWLKHPFADALRRWPEHFTVAADRVLLQPDLDTFKLRTAAFAEVTAALAEDGWFALQHEPFPVKERYRAPACLTLDRAAASFFGVCAYGQHLNGFVRNGGVLKVWVGKRAADRHHFPGMLDNMVAGGLPYGISLRDNLLKECHEEAGVSAELAATARATGAVTYTRETEKGLKPDTMFCYDLELPPEFVPRCTDGEVESFMLMTAAEVAEIVRDSEQFKPNCNLVIIDFLIRHGVITPDEPDYLELLTGLHPPLFSG